MEIQQTVQSEKTETATFAAGCFWGVEESFRTLPGVVSTQVGYTGGHAEHPSYEQVCADKTGHAEALNIIYDPLKINYETLVKRFWEIHDPTTMNMQGPDVGSQYRSAVFFHGDDQKHIAERTKGNAQKMYTRDIVTEIVPATTFWPAEEYHQQYFMKRGGGVCHI